VDPTEPALDPALDPDLEPSDPGGPVARVLVVDDHPANRLAVEAVLEPLGHELVMASSGREALGHLLQQEFALILLDVQMDGMDGLETATLIKQTKRTRHTPIIFLTAVSRDAEHIFRGYKHGAVDYLVKPFDPDALRAKVSVFVDLYVQSEQIKHQARMLAENTQLYEHERRARAEAEAAMRAREHVLAVVSHDLRGPLASIMIGASMLAEELPASAENASFVKHAAAIKRATEQMSQLLNDLLDVSRIESGYLSLEREPHPSAELIRAAVETFQPQAEQRRLQLHFDDEAGNTHVLCDRSRVLQVFSNLAELPGRQCGAVLGRGHGSRDSRGAVAAHLQTLLASPNVRSRRSRPRPRDCQRHRRSTRWCYLGRKFSGWDHVHVLRSCCAWRAGSHLTPE
jgi:CheY-like chemotaxis protein